MDIHPDRFDSLTPAGPAGTAPRLTYDAHTEVIATVFEHGFPRGSAPTLGVEEELVLVDPEALEPVDEIEWVLGESGDDPRFKPELRAAQIELVTPVCASVSEVCLELAGARADLVEMLDGHVRLVAAGTHPLSTRPIAINPGRRYLELALDNPWFVRCGLPSALHVHVGIGDPDDALAVYNAARSYLPELAALAANSPFFEGRDTGLASSRLKLCEDSPRTGIPPAFDSWRELARFVAWGARGRLFPDLSYLWWDLRPRPDLGTLEFRIADSQTCVASTSAIVALCQSLVVWLQARRRDGERLAVHAMHLITENRWRALRDGLDGELVDPETGTSEPTRHRLARLLDHLEPHAGTLGCAGELAQIETLLACGGGAGRQRAVAAQQGLTGLMSWLADTTERAHEPSGRNAHTVSPYADAARPG